MRTDMRTTLLILIPFLLLVTPVFSQEATHTVRKGETLYSIARNYNIDVNALIQFNQIKDPSKLSVGSILKLPSLYRVEKGDTLYGLAKKYNTTIENLVTINNLSTTQVLKVGDLIVLPTKEEQREEESLPEETQIVISTPVKTKTDAKILPTESSNPSTNTVNTVAVSWPHTGVRELLTGKLEGIAIRGKPGDSVVSVTYGEVVLVQPFRGYGKLICIQTPGNYIYAYAGNEVTLVKVGDKVFPGMEIGRASCRERV